MNIPVIRGMIDRRILVNFRIDPELLRRQLPEPFRPKVVNGFGIAGICLIRLKDIRPLGLPSLIGLSSENAAHRIAVEWIDGSELREGVYIPRRDTSSRLNTFLGGKAFPVVQHHAHFEVSEKDDFYRIEMESDDGEVRLAVEAEVSDDLNEQSTFDSLQAASAFFEKGSVGYAPGIREGELHGIELHSFSWQVAPLNVKRVESSYFQNGAMFTEGAAQFDCALLMRRIEHEWRVRQSFGTPTAA
jgi:uncharacterized protein DUF2071